MSKHTHGPWTAEPRDANNWRVHSEDWGTLAYLEDPYHAAPDGMIEANAQLMADAPDLLEALTEAAHECANVTATMESVERLKDLAQHWIAIVAKAEAK